MEPRNIGVVLWSDGIVHARFLGESTDGLTIPKDLNIESRDAYRQWIQYWRIQLGKDIIRTRSGEKIGKDNPKFVEELVNRSKDQFFLSESGFLMDHPTTPDLNQAVNELFEELVSYPEQSRKKRISKQNAQELRNRCTELMENTGIAKRKDYWPDQSWICPVGSTKQTFKFDYMLYTSKPNMVLSRVPLSDDRSVYSTAFRFEHMQKAFGIPREKCAALVLVDPKELVDELLETYSMMNSIGVVVNVTNVGVAANELLSLVA